jgi:hypothetical protein
LHTGQMLLVNSMNTSSRSRLPIPAGRSLVIATPSSQHQVTRWPNPRPDAAR